MLQKSKLVHARTAQSKNATLQARHKVYHFTTDSAPSALRPDKGYMSSITVSNGECRTSTSRQVRSGAYSI